MRAKKKNGVRVVVKNNKINIIFARRRQGENITINNAIE